MKSSPSPEKESARSSAEIKALWPCESSIELSDPEIVTFPAVQVTIA
jgi:hypothetical protein